jgi:hypothetical protein
MQQRHRQDMQQGTRGLAPQIIPHTQSPDSQSLSARCARSIFRRNSRSRHRRCTFCPRPSVRNRACGKFLVGAAQRRPAPRKISMSALIKAHVPQRIITSHKGKNPLTYATRPAAALQLAAPHRRHATEELYVLTM